MEAHNVCASSAAHPSGLKVVFLFVCFVCSAHPPPLHSSVRNSAEVFDAMWWGHAGFIQTMLLDSSENGLCHWCIVVFVVCLIACSKREREGGCVCPTASQSSVSIGVVDFSEASQALAAEVFCFLSVFLTRVCVCELDCHVQLQDVCCSCRVENNRARNPRPPLVPTVDRLVEPCENRPERHRRLVVVGAQARTQ